MKFAELDSSDEDMWTAALSDTTDPEVRIRFLAMRLSVVVREKELIELRLAKLERAYTMGQGIFWFIPFVAGAIGIVVANWGWVTKPWTSGK